MIIFIIDLIAALPSDQHREFLPDVKRSYITLLQPVQKDVSIVSLYHIEGDILYEFWPLDLSLYHLFIFCLQREIVLPAQC